jgi:arginyl-tRNA--protein-N-Asp/Glu arginylyltransferase
MKYLTEVNKSIHFDCPYIIGQKAQYEMFHAYELSYEDLDSLLEKGYRKFGKFFFKPACPSCSKCVPIRIPVDKITPSKSQRRSIRKAENVEVTFSELTFTDEIFRIYCEHSQKFENKECSIDHFIQSFYERSGPALQSNYFLDKTLIAVGFIDHSSNAFSSVYFIYRNGYEKLSLGTVSVFMECNEALRRGLSYYYLGYYVSENHSMNYKNRFAPHELYDWENQRWYQPPKANF